MKLLLFQGAYFDTWHVPPPVYSWTSRGCAQFNALGENQARGVNGLDFGTIMTEEQQRTQRHLLENQQKFLKVCATELSFVKAIK